jgi:hypothetical protein
VAGCLRLDRTSLPTDPPGPRSQRNRIVPRDSETLIAISFCWLVAQGLINGKARVAVPAALGKDIAIDGGVGQESVGVLKEIWELQDGGANPILLERHSLPISSTIYTQQEAPANIPADTPPGSGT